MKYLDYLVIYLIILFIAIVIVLYPKLDKKHKFRFNLLCNGILNSFLIILLIVLLTMKDPKIGILCLVLYFSILYQNKIDSDMYEGFISYYKK